MRNPNTQLDLSKKVSKIEKGIKIDKKYIPSSNIQKMVKKLKAENIKGLKNIQEFFVKSKDKVSDRDAKIISSVLNAKQDGKKIYINTSLFTQRLETYLSTSNISSKCFTNEKLNLYMIKSMITNRMDDKEIYELAFIDEARIISNNFNLEEKTLKGYIQDYDPNFSVMGTRNYSRDKIETMLKVKPAKGNFEFEGIQYVYFGDENICFIMPDGLPEDEALEKYDNAAYLINNRAGKFTLGERKVYPNENNDLCYIDKDIIPEGFCPAYWFSDTDMKLSYLFKCYYDYNDLFDELDKNRDEIGNKGFVWPNNMCYWNTLNECFQFLSILAIAGQNISDDYRNTISKWCDDYFDLKTTLSLWKNNQMLYQRIIQDFLYGFLNNSEPKRFQNLLSKVEKYIAVAKELRAHSTFSNIKAFFSSLPFAQMINKQLSAEVYSIAFNIRSCIQQYLSGARPDNIITNIRNVAKMIRQLMPKDKVEDAAFPVLIADGGLLGDGVIFGAPKTDPLFDQVYKNAVKKEVQKKKHKNEVEKISDLLINKDTVLRNYLVAYIRKYTADKKVDRNRFTITPLIKIIRTKMTEDKDEGDKIVQEAVKFTADEKQRIGKTWSDFLNDIIDEYLSDRGINVKKKTSSKRSISGKRKDKMDVEEEDEEEDEKEDTKSVQEALPRYNLRSKKK